MANVTVLTQKGEEWIVDKLDSSVVTTPKYIGWGTGAGEAAKGDTALFSESVDEARVEGVLSQPVADKLRCVGTMTCATNPKTITNAGSFVVDTEGNPIVKGNFTGVPLAVDDKIEFTVDLEIT